MQLVEQFTVKMVGRGDSHGEVIINCRPRKTRKKYRKRQIRRRIEKNKIDIIVKRFENDDKMQTVIIKKVSFGAKLLEILIESIFVLLKFLFWILICALITIGLNTLLNNQLREQVINMIRDVMGG
ncbi:MAG: hypothetical protein ACERKZ_05290 [Lachnotalea sp.]